MTWWIGWTKEHVAELTRNHEDMAKSGETDYTSHRHWLTQVARVSILEIKLKEYLEL